MIHLMELPNPDPIEGRPKHGGRDRHACVTVKDVLKIKEVFEKAGMHVNVFVYSITTCCNLSYEITTEDAGSHKLLCTVFSCLDV